MIAGEYQQDDIRCLQCNLKILGCIIVTNNFVAECLISSVVLLPISLYFSIFVLSYFDDQFLDDSFGNSDHNSVRPKKQPDRNIAESQPVKPNTTQHESQMTRRRFGRESLSTSQISWDMRHDLRPEPWVPLAFHQVLCLPSLCQTKLFFSTSTPKNSMANSSNRRPANNEAEGSRADARRRW
jgi:hypothetical protein